MAMSVKMYLGAAIMSRDKEGGNNDDKSIDATSHFANTASNNSSSSGQDKVLLERDLALLLKTFTYHGSNPHLNAEEWRVLILVFVFIVPCSPRQHQRAVATDGDCHPRSLQGNNFLMIDSLLFVTG